MQGQLIQRTHNRKIVGSKSVHNILDGMKAKLVIELKREICKGTKYLKITANNLFTKCE
jgi:hypothetical protein